MIVLIGQDLIAGKGDRKPLIRGDLTGEWSELIWRHKVLPDIRWVGYPET